MHTYAARCYVTVHENCTKVQTIEGCDQGQCPSHTHQGKSETSNIHNKATCPPSQRNNCHLGFIPAVSDDRSYVERRAPDLRSRRALSPILPSPALPGPRH